MQDVKSDRGAFAAAASCHMHLSTVLFWEPSKLKYSFIKFKIILNATSFCQHIYHSSLTQPNHKHISLTPIVKAFNCIHIYNYKSTHTTNGDARV